MTSDEARNQLCLEFSRIHSAFGHLQMSSTMFMTNVRMVFVKDSYFEKIKTLTANIEITEELWGMGQMFTQFSHFNETAVVKHEDLPESNIWSLFDEFLAATFNVNFFSDLYIDGAATRGRNIYNLVLYDFASLYLEEMLEFPENQHVLHDCFNHALNDMSVLKMFPRIKSPEYQSPQITIERNNVVECRTCGEQWYCEFTKPHRIAELFSQRVGFKVEPDKKRL